MRLLRILIDDEPRTSPPALAAIGWQFFSSEALDAADVPFLGACAPWTPH
jgi:hypothetical protein